MGDDAQQVQGVCMVRMGRQHAPIAGLGLGQPPGTVVVEAGRQELRRRSDRWIAGRSGSCLSESGLANSGLAKSGGSAALLAIHARV